VSHNQPTDELLSLLGDCIAGSRDAWHTFFGSVSPLLYGMLRNAGASHHVAEDIIGDLFVRLMEEKAYRLREASFYSEGQFRKWLISITKNLYISHCRHQSCVQNLAGSADRPANPGGSHYSNNTMNHDFLSDICNRDEIDKAFSCLSVTEQWIVTLAYKDELKIKEISEVTGKPIGTITSLLSRAREKMRNYVHHLGILVRSSKEHDPESGRLTCPLIKTIVAQSSLRYRHTWPAC